MYIRGVISNARNIIDITILYNSSPDPRVPALPDGEFQQAICDGLWNSVQANHSPLVRIFVGIPTPTLSIVVYEKIKNWFTATIQLRGKQIAEFPLTALIFYCNSSLTSWNHSKIVASDGTLAMVGGHNLWAGDYLGKAPVHDISLYIKGPVVGMAHKFCGKLMQGVSRCAMLEKGTYYDNKPPSSPLFPLGQYLFSNGKTMPIPLIMPRQIDSSIATSRVLALGRLGSGIDKDFDVVSNASVSARVIAFCSAQKSIKLSQQSLVFFPGRFDFYTVWALVKAIEAGVEVQIVVSNDKAPGGYSGRPQTVVDIITTLAVASKLKLYSPEVDPQRSDYKGWAHAALRSPISELPIAASRLPTPEQYQPVIDKVNKLLSVAPLYYAENCNTWTCDGSQTEAINHAKAWIIDDSQFYVGSDNVYLSGTSEGLQEYGHLVDGRHGFSNASSEFIASYWDKLWRYSSSHLVRPGTPKLVAPQAT